jgi:hypothetical protein
MGRYLQQMALAAAAAFLVVLVAWVASVALADSVAAVTI